MRYNTETAAENAVDLELTSECLDCVACVFASWPIKANCRELKKHHGK